MADATSTVHGSKKTDVKRKPLDTEFRQLGVRFGGKVHRVPYSVQSKVLAIINKLEPLVKKSSTRELVLSYKNVDLQHDWIISDLVPNGSILVARLQPMRKPTLHVELPYGPGKLSLYEPKKVHLLTGRQLKTLISSNTGLPPSVFRLLALYKRPPARRYPRRKEITPLASPGYASPPSTPKTPGADKCQFVRQEFHASSREDELGLESHVRVLTGANNDIMDDIDDKAGGSDGEDGSSQTANSQANEDDAASDLDFMVGLDDKEDDLEEMLQISRDPVMPRHFNARKLLDGEPEGTTTEDGWYMREIFDMQKLSSFGIRCGGRVWLEVWDGWPPMLNYFEPGPTRRPGKVQDFMSFINSACTSSAERAYMSKAALYIAAFKNTTDVAAFLTQERKIRPDEPVGVHPSKEWCVENFLSIDKDAPIHIAVTRGHFKLVQFFIHISAGCTTVKDSHGRIIIDLAKHHGQTEIFNMLKGTKDFNIMKERMKEHDTNIKKQKMWEGIIHQGEVERGVKAKHAKFMETSVTNTVPLWVRDREVAFDHLSIGVATHVTCVLKMKADKARVAVREKGEVTLPRNFLKEYGIIKHAHGRMVLGREWCIEGVTKSKQTSKYRPAIAATVAQAARSDVTGESPGVTSILPPLSPRRSLSTSSTFTSRSSSKASRQLITPKPLGLRAVPEQDESTSTAVEIKLADSKKIIFGKEPEQKKFRGVRDTTYMSSDALLKKRQRRKTGDDDGPLELEEKTMRKICKNSLGKARTMHGEKGNILKTIKTATCIAGRAIREQREAELKKSQRGKPSSTAHL